MERQHVFQCGVRLQHGYRHQRGFLQCAHVDAIPARRGAIR
jgi:hypothetical protein